MLMAGKVRVQGGMIMSFSPLAIFSGGPSFKIRAPVRVTLVTRFLNSCPPIHIRAAASLHHPLVTSMFGFRVSMNLPGEGPAAALSVALILAARVVTVATLKIWGAVAKLKISFPAWTPLLLLCNAPALAVFFVEIAILVRPVTPTDIVTSTSIFDDQLKIPIPFPLALSSGFQIDQGPAHNVGGHRERLVCTAAGPITLLE